MNFLQNINHVRGIAIHVNLCCLAYLFARSISFGIVVYCTWWMVHSQIELPSDWKVFCYCWYNYSGWHDISCGKDQIRGFEGEIERRTVTYTLWNQSTRDQERKGWHPVTFTYSDTSPELVDGIKVCLLVTFVVHESIQTS